MVQNLVHISCDVPELTVNFYNITFVRVCAEIYRTIIMTFALLLLAGVANF